VKIKLDEGAFCPTRAHDIDAGLDLYARETQMIHPHSSAIFRTGVHVELPPGCAGVLISKSGLNVKDNITSTGLIDQGYTGEITVKLYNHGDDSVPILRGHKISQLVVVPVRYEPVEIVDEIDGGERGDAGFGSTGRS
jgi:dUTP pyrophosphatase